VNGAVVAFAGPFAHTGGILAGALGDHDVADAMLRRSIGTARQLGADVWVRRGQTARDTLAKQRTAAAAPDPADVAASLTRTGNIWTITWRGERAQLAHVKGLADIAMLVRHRGQEVPSLLLAGSTQAAGSSDHLIDLDALGAYRSRLAELAAEIDQTASDGDIGRTERLENEREHLLAEVRRTTGLGGRLRTGANEPAERARKAVTARIRDAVRRLDAAAPLLAAHLDRSIQTGLRCSYTPGGQDASIRWNVEA
jgi:hypothetical protein